MIKTYRSSDGDIPRRASTRRAQGEGRVKTNAPPAKLYSSIARTNTSNTAHVEETQGGQVKCHMPTTAVAQLSQHRLQHPGVGPVQLPGQTHPHP